MRTAILVGILTLILLLAGCSSCPATCSDGKYCTEDFCGEDTDNQCKHAPIAGCDETVEHAKADCSGKVAGSALLEKTWDAKGKTCAADIPSSKQSTRTFTQEAIASGDKFTIQSSFKNPFNTGKDTFDVTIGFKTAANADHKFKRLTITARTPDKRTITIADKTLSTPLWNSPESEVFETIPLTVPEDGAQGTLKEVTLTADYEYTVVAGTTRSQKTGTFKVLFRNEDLTWVRPSTTYACRQCEQRAGQRSECSAQTQYFCEYYPEASACGNFACDDGENKCSCPTDCGPCIGGTASLEFSCVQDACKARLRSSVAPALKTDVDDRDLGPVSLQNTYEYMTPFNIDNDTIIARFGIYEKIDNVTRVRIQSIRVLEGGQQLTEVEPNVFLPPKGGSEEVRISIPPSALTAPEQQKSLTLSIWYSYKRGDTEERGSWSKQLRERITLVNPDA